MIYKINKRVLIEENLLNHFRDNKNAYLAGAAGLGAAGLGTYLAMSSGDHTGLDNRDKERELQQKLDEKNAYDSGIRVGLPTAAAGALALGYLGISAASSGNIGKNISSGLNKVNAYRNDMANARNNILAKQQAAAAARKKAAETPSTKYKPSIKFRSLNNVRSNTRAKLKF